jgi:uncharacterized protein involved in exopolysaccharide biosynthesis
VVDDAGFYLPGFEDLPRQMKIEVLKRGTLDLRPVRNTSIIEIRVYSRDKNAAAKVANTIAQTYKAHRLEERKRLTQGGIDALTNRLAAVQMELDRARSKVAALQSDKQSQACLAATQDLEQLQRLRQILFEKISFERIELDLPKTSMVEMIDPATPARTPIYPKKALNVATGMLTGVLLGSLASALVPWLILSARKSPILSA